MARRAVTHPYVACWMGNIGALNRARGELSAHTRPELAARACRRQRDAIASLFGGDKPWFIYRVIDARDGSVVSLLT